MKDALQQVGTIFLEEHGQTTACRIIKAQHHHHVGAADVDVVLDILKFSS
jgi:hypothetical protein